MAVQSTGMEAAGPYDRAKALSAFKFGDVSFYWITRASAISVLLILGGIILSLIVGAWPAMREYGFSFLLTSRWAPSADRHRRGTARRNPVDHLRHVGLLRAGTVPRQQLPALHDQGVCQCAGAEFDLRRPAVLPQPVQRGADSRHHGAALHHRDFG